MKKLPAVFPAVLCMTLFFSGCSSQSSVPSPRAAIDKDAEISFQGETYKCRINYLNRNTSSITFSSPESLSGLSFKRSDGTVSVSLGNLMCRNENLLLPQSSLLTRVTKLFDCVSSDELSFTAQHGENYEFSDKNSTVSLLTDKDGEPLRIFSDDLKIKLYSK